MPLILTTPYLKKLVSEIMSGMLASWGFNSTGQLGKGHNTVSGENWTPVSIGNSNDFSYITCGSNSSYALKSDNSLWSWGYGGYGQLGNNGSSANLYTPTKIGTARWRHISSGWYHAVGIQLDGTLWATGSNLRGQLGKGSVNQNFFAYEKIGTDTDWKKVQCGPEFTIALKENGTLWATGDNTQAQLGQGTSTNTASTRLFNRIGSDTDWKDVACGQGHVVALKTDGTLWYWGSNIGPTKTLPTKIGSGWSSIACGGYHAVALHEDGSLWAWGMGSQGQHGRGNTDSLNSPVRVGTANNWKQIACGWMTTYAIKNDGSLWACGLNNNGQTGTGISVDQNVLTFTPVGAAGSIWKLVAAGDNFALGLKA